jgi:hypothetical protein
MKIIKNTVIDTSFLTQLKDMIRRGQICGLDKKKMFHWIRVELEILNHLEQVAIDTMGKDAVEKELSTEAMRGLLGDAYKRNIKRRIIN